MPKSKKRAVQPDHNELQQRSKRQHSGEARSHRMSSEEEYTTDDLSSEEDQHHHRPVTTAPAALSGRKSTAKPRRWQPHEDKLLTAAVHQCGEANWKSIASKVGTRNHVQCLQRWKKVLRPGLVKGQWDAEEDAALMKLATAPFKNWGTLSTQMSGRTSKQCRERWCHHLNPDINKGPYTRQEDETILKVHEKLGNKWSLIAAKLPGRTENSIKIRCKALQRKNGGARISGSGSSSGGGGGRGRGRGGGKSAAKSSPRAAKNSACTSTSSASSSAFLSSAVPASLSGSPSEAGGSMAADESQPVSGRPVAPGALAPLPPQRRPGSSSRGLKFDPLFMGPSDSPGLPAASPGHDGALHTAGNRYGRFGAKAEPFGAKPEPLEWPPSADVGDMFPIGNHHHHQQQQQQQQQRYQPIPTVGQHFVYGGRPIRGGFLGGLGSGSGSSGGEGMFDSSRLTPPGASYLGQARQVPIGHFAPDFNSPPPLPPSTSASARGGHGQGEIYPGQRQACLINDDDDELEAEALAAVGADGIPSAGTAATAAGSMASLAGNIASLDEISATIRAAAGQDAGGGDGQPGDDFKAAGVGDRGEGGAGEEGNGPLRSCCSFLALNAQDDDIVGDADSWQEGKGDDGGDDGGGALMMD
eukprot:g9978.t1